MNYLRSLEPDAGLLQIFQAFPEVARPLLEYYEALLRVAGYAQLLDFLHCLEIEIWNSGRVRASYVMMASLVGST